MNHRKAGRDPSSAEIQSIQMEWAQNMVQLVGGKLKVRGAKARHEPCLVVSNHMGYVDIPVLMALFPFAYVAKKAISKWPVFGPGAASVGTVFVDRSSPQNRRDVAVAIGDSIEKKSKGVILFPEGTSSVFGKTWKRGAFTIAQERGLWVQPARIVYTPVKKVAYYGDDIFIPHILKLLKDGSFEVDVELGEPTKILDAEADRVRLETWVHQSVKEALAQQGLSSESDLVE